VPRVLHSRAIRDHDGWNLGPVVGHAHAPQEARVEPPESPACRSPSLACAQPVSEAAVKRSESSAMDARIERESCAHRTRER
jgi:hypothetical protein